MHAVAAGAAGQSPGRSALWQGRNGQAGGADAAWEEAAHQPAAAQLPGEERQPAAPEQQQWGHAEPAVDMPLPGTPAAAAPPVHWEDAAAEGLALGTPATAGFGPDQPAAATLPSPFYTPGPAGMADGLLGGFTPSTDGAGGSGSMQLGKPVWGSPAGWGSPASAAAAGGSPAGAPQGAAMAGGPQVPAGPKAAFASWAAAVAARATAVGR